MHVCAICAIICRRMRGREHGGCDVLGWLVGWAWFVGGVSVCLTIKIQYKSKSYDGDVSV